MLSFDLRAGFAPWMFCWTCLLYSLCSCGVLLPLRASDAETLMASCACAGVTFSELRTDLFAARGDGEIVDDGDLEAIVEAVDGAVAMSRQWREENIGPRWRSSTGW